MYIIKLPFKTFLAMCCLQIVGKPVCKLLIRPHILLYKQLHMVCQSNFTEKQQFIQHSELEQLVNTKW